MFRGMMDNYKSSFLLVYTACFIIFCSCDNISLMVGLCYLYVAVIKIRADVAKL